MPGSVCRVVLVAAVGAGFGAASLAVERPARAEHCWLYVDGVDYSSPPPRAPVFPGFEFTKTPFTCVPQGTMQGSCSWSESCDDDGNLSDCCTSIPNPGEQQSILSMHTEWHDCFGNTGGEGPFAGRGARWLAFHRQFELDFDLMREATFPCGPGVCQGGACFRACSADSQCGGGQCVNGSCTPNVSCATDEDCSAHDGCFFEAIDWYQNMVFPYGHFGAGLASTAHPSGCGQNLNRPGGIACSSCLALPTCLFNAGSGPMSGETPSPATNANCLSYVGQTLDQIPTLDEVARVLDASHHADFHTDVGLPFGTATCSSDAQCRQRATDACTAAGISCPCDPGTGDGCPVCRFVPDFGITTCAYNTDALNPSCSPRDPMFWRLHKRLDDTVRAWQEKRPFDLSVVIDRSGSMSETDQSGRTKIQVATEALQMLADLLPDAQNSRIGVVSYASDRTEDMPLTPAASSAGAIASVAAGLEARVGGCTSIGSGLEAAVTQVCNGTLPGSSPAKDSCHPNHGQLTGSGENERKGVLLLTDGLENVAPCLRSTGATPAPFCGDVCGGEQFNFDLLGPHTQLCAVGFGQGASVNGNLLTLLAERQGGIYMQSPAKGADDQDGVSGQGRWVDLKDFFVKCFGSLSDEFVGVDPKGVLRTDEFSTTPVTYGSCDDERLSFISGWNVPVSGGIRLMVNTPSGDLVRASDPLVESSLKNTWSFLRANLPFRGQLAGTWRAQLIRPHFSYVNGFTTDSLPTSVSVPMVRREIQRLCPDGCGSAIYFEDGHLGPESSYEVALAAEQSSGLVTSVTRALSAADFHALLQSTPFDLIVYAHQMTDQAEPYDATLAALLCQNHRAIVTETRLQAPSSPIAFINSCPGGIPTGEVNFTGVVGDGRLLEGQHTLVNRGYTRFSYGQSPSTLGGRTQATFGGGGSAAISADGATGCGVEICPPPPEQEWFMDVLVRGRSQLDDAPLQVSYRTGQSGILPSVRVLPANVPLGGYDQTNVRVEVERPLIGIGQTLLNLGPQAPGATPTADGLFGRSAALAVTTPIPTVKQTFVMNDDGVGADELPRNGYWTAHVPDSNVPGQCLVDGIYRMHVVADFVKNGCSTRRELVRSTFVEVGVDPVASGLTTTPLPGGLLVNICPRDACGNPIGWGRQVSCGPAPGCSCAPQDIVDHGDGCYTVTVHVAENARSCEIGGLGPPISVANPVPEITAPPLTFLRCVSAPVEETLTVSVSGGTLTSGRVVSINGQPPPSPISIDVTTRRVALPIGTIVVEWTATGPSGATATALQTIQVVPGMMTTETFDVRDRARLLTGSGSLGVLANRGSGITRVGVEARTGQIQSVAAVDVRDRAVVTGGITSSMNVAIGNGVSLTGGVQENASVVLPPAPDLSEVVFPPATGGSVTVDSGTRNLAPGSYATVTLNGGTLSMVGGDYYFERLFLNSGTTVRAAAGARIFVQTDLAFRSPILAPTGTTVQPVFLGFLGPNLVVEARFDGTFVAPQAQVSFGIGSGLTFTGTFFARSIELRPDSRLVCQPGTAAPPTIRPGTCFDGLQNGTETDIDCGGGACARCAVGQACGVPADCLGGVCANGACQAGANLNASVTITSDWGNGYCAVFNVTNTAASPTTNWNVSANIGAATIYTSWNGTFGGSTGIFNVAPAFSWNRPIAPGGTNSSVGFCANRNVPAITPVVLGASGSF